MTVATLLNKITYQGNGSTTVFTFPFPAVAASDLQVFFTDALGNITLLSPIAYTVALNPALAPNPTAAGGTITYNPAGGPIALGTKLTIYRNLPEVQNTSLANQGTLFQPVLEQSLDYLMMSLQQVFEVQNRAIVVAVSDPVPLALPPAAQRASLGMGFDSAGNPIAISSAPAGTISSAMAPVVAAATIATARSLLGLGTDYLNVTSFGAIGDGVTDNTAAINSATASAASTGRGVFFPAGSYVTQPITLPVGLSGFFGESRGSIIKFARQAYSPGTLLLTASLNTASLQINNLTFDTNTTQFVSTTVIGVTNSNNLRISNVNMLGEGAFAIRISSGDNVIIRDVTCTGTNDGFSVCVQGDATGGAALNRMQVESCRFTGVHGYGVELINGDGLSILNCKNDNNTGASFAFGLSGSTSSSISGCVSIDSSHEAFQLTDCSYSTIVNCRGEWTTLGNDFGISINGTINKARFNVIANNTILNSFKAGVGLADWTQHTMVVGNVFKDSGVRGTAASGSGGAICQIIAYTITSAAVNTDNHIRDNIFISEAGTTTFGFQENNGGVGTVDGNFFGQNFSSGTTTPFQLAGANSVYFNDLWLSYVPVITSGTGTITSTTTNSANYRIQGKTIEIQLDITITNAGTGAGALIVTLPINAATNGGALTGRDVGLGKGVDGAASGSQIQFFLADVSTPVATNARIVVSGVYHTT